MVLMAVNKSILSKGVVTKVREETAEDENPSAGTASQSQSRGNLRVKN